MRNNLMNSDSLKVVIGLTIIGRNYTRDTNFENEGVDFFYEFVYKFINIVVFLI